MESKSNNMNLVGLFKELGSVLMMPVTLTGRPVSADELRKRRAARARKKLMSGETQEGPRSTPFSLNGVIEVGENSSFAIDGRDFVIDDTTWMVGIPVPGAYAAVKGITERDGVSYAKSVVVAKTTK